MVHNFSAGPAALPESVLQRIKDDIPDWAGTGMSVMEVSHRSKEFVGVAEDPTRYGGAILSSPDLVTWTTVVDSSEAAAADWRVGMSA